MSELSQLSEHSIIVADTGDVDSIKVLKPTDATTNPSLILKAAGQEQYASIVDGAVAFGIKESPGDEDGAVREAMDKLAVAFGVEIVKIVPGVVSTEVDARLSFDTDATVAKARRLIELYKAEGVPKERILIKIAATWEGVRAAEILEKEGITTNMTLIFSLAQAVASAEAGATLISPFVGRITDWYKASTGTESYPVEEDPGVLSVRRIYRHLKSRGFKTVVMGASFRSKEQVLGLAGCDKLTIAPQWLESLRDTEKPVSRVLSAEQKSDDPVVSYNEQNFRWALNEDAMATEKLAEGIRKFAADIVKLERIVRERIAAAGK